MEVEYLGESIRVYNEGGWDVENAEAQREIFRVVAKATGWAVPPDASYGENAPWFFEEKDSDRAMVLMERVIRGECEKRKESSSMAPLLQAAGLGPELEARGSASPMKVKGDREGRSGVLQQERAGSVEQGEAGSVRGSLGDLQERPNTQPQPGLALCGPKPHTKHPPTHTHHTKHHTKHPHTHTHHTTLHTKHPPHTHTTLNTRTHTHKPRTHRTALRHLHSYARGALAHCRARGARHTTLNTPAHTHTTLHSTLRTPTHAHTALNTRTHTHKPRTHRTALRHLHSYARGALAHC